jgi:hypothetical protein
MTNSILFSVAPATGRMRFLISLLLLLLAATGCFANEIDKLHSVSEVAAFLRAHAGKGWHEETFFAPATTDTTGSKPNFFKLDLDANGLTDLVINGNYLFALTDDGNGQYTEHFISPGMWASSRPKLLAILPRGRTPLLVVQRQPPFYRPGPATAKPDTLLLKFGDFVEYQPATTKLQISQLSFSTSGCYGTCPIFNLVIHSNRKATYQAVEYNKRKGSFTATLDTATYNRLAATLHYIQLLALQDTYRVGWTDDQTVNLAVTLRDGRVKKIQDYGAVGTFGLANLYAQLFKLRETQAWK